MPKGYWITSYRGISAPEKLKRYAELAGPAIAKAGGKFLARGTAAFALEQGIKERTVLIEFASLAAAKAAYDSADYRKALEALSDGAQRDVRLIEGVA